MSSTGQPSSSQQKNKAPAQRLTSLQEQESEIADLRRQVRDIQQERHEDQTRIERFEKEQNAQKEVIDRLQQETSFHQKYVFQREDLFRKHCEEIRAADRRNRLESADARNMIDEFSGSVPLSASTRAESKERANPQLEQSGSQNHAEELESQAMSIDTSEEGFETVKDRKNILAGGAGSEAIIPTGSPSNTNFFRAIDPDDPIEKKRAPKEAKNLNQRPAPTGYVAPSAEVNSDQQSRVDLTISTPRRISFSAPDPYLSALAGTSGWGSGDRRVFDTLPSMQRRSALQAPNSPPTPRTLSQPEHVRSLAIPHGTESVKDFAQVAATPAGPTSGGKSDFVEKLWENYNARREVKVDFDTAFAEWKRKRAAKSSRPGKEQTQGVGESSTPKTGHSKAATAGLQSVDKDVVSETKFRWSEETEEDGGVEVTGNVPKAGLVKDVLPPKEGVVSQSGSSRTMDRSPKEGHTPAKAPATHIKLEKDSTSSIEADKGQVAHEPDQSALAPATPLPSREQVDKESKPESQQVEQGTGNGNPTIKTESGKVGDGTGGFPLGSRGPSIAPDTYISPSRRLRVPTSPAVGPQERGDESSTRTARQYFELEVEERAKMAPREISRALEGAVDYVR